ncbi:MAG TPA: YajQ family cyclic di-GMP-binding protein [Steroidobacteraceae bacterium]|nr:YajQ family cyclic di-GMP-binding protein [Steroidobacteraceae bacterium]
MPSFDVVSQLDPHEVTNAVDQANREIAQRFDFKGTGAKFELEDFKITLHAQVDFQLKQMLEILKLRISKRGIDVICMQPGEPQIALNAARQEVVLRHGIDTESARQLVKVVKESKLKVQAAIQGDKVRVTGKQRDDLQSTMALLRKTQIGLPLQFVNFRD